MRKKDVIYDLRHVNFEESCPRSKRARYHRRALAPLPDAAHVDHEPQHDPFIEWVLQQAQLDCSKYRSKPLLRRRRACLRLLRADSTQEAQELLTRRPEMIGPALSSLLIGVTEFFRERPVFNILRHQVLPSLAHLGRPLRIWSASCSNGAELYSLAILLVQSGLLKRSYLLGSDCRSDAIEEAQRGVYSQSLLSSLEHCILDRFFHPTDGGRWQVRDELRGKAEWKVGDVTCRIEQGPWDIILWRNAAIYLRGQAAEKVWRQMLDRLSPEGFLVTGRAERPPQDAARRAMHPCIYRPCHRNPLEAST